MRLSRRKKICYPVFATFNKPPEEKNRSHWKFWLAGVFFILLLGGAVYLFVFSPVFKIKTIKISGNNLIAAPDIEAVARNILQAKIFKFIPRDTALVFIDNKIKQDIFASFPEIASVEVVREKINGLDISLDERKAAAVVCLAQIRPSPSPSALVSLSPSLSPSPSSVVTSTPALAREAPPEGERCFFADDSGLIYRQAPEISGTLLPTFYTNDASLCQIRQQAVYPSIIQFVSLLKKELQSNGVDLTSFVLNSELNSELRAFTSEGWFIYFDTGRSPLIQSKILEALLRDEIKNNRAMLQYVDLRVEDRVYYK